MTSSRLQESAADQFLGCSLGAAMVAAFGRRSLPWGTYASREVPLKRLFPCLTTSIRGVYSSQ